MASLTKPALNLREFLARIVGLEMRMPPRRASFEFDTELDGSNAILTLPAGWKPGAVYLTGSRQREGSANDYTAAFDGFLWSVTFTTTPASSDWAAIDCEEAS